VAFRSIGTLADLRALNDVLASDHRVTQIVPLTHGNAWSVYFRDPELNGVEVFIDTPWHVRQPQPWKYVGSLNAGARNSTRRES